MAPCFGNMKEGPLRCHNLKSWGPKRALPFLTSWPLNKVVGSPDFSARSRGSPWDKDFEFGSIGPFRAASTKPLGRTHSNNLKVGLFQKRPRGPKLDTVAPGPPPSEPPKARGPRARGKSGASCTKSLSLPSLSHTHSEPFVWLQGSRRVLLFPRSYGSVLRKHERGAPEMP